MRNQCILAVSLGLIMIVILGIVALALLGGSNALDKPPVPAQTQITVIPIAVDGEPTTRGWGLAGYIAVVGEYSGELVPVQRTVTTRGEYYALRTLIDTAIKRGSAITFTGRWESGMFVMSGIEVMGKGMMLEGKEQ